MKATSLFYATKFLVGLGRESHWPHQALLEGIWLLDRSNKGNTLKMMWEMGVYVRTPKCRFFSLFGKKSKIILLLEAFLVFKKHCKVTRKLFLLFRSILPQSRNKLQSKYIIREGCSCNPYPITTTSRQFIRPT